MTIQEFIEKYYPRGFYANGKPLPGRREEFNRRNSQWLCHGKKADVVFVGDSIVDWWELAVYFSRYGVVLNRGYAGECTPKLVKRFAQDALDLSPKAVVMLEGINDISKAHQRIKKGKTDWQTELKKMQKNYRAIFSLAKNAGVKMVVCSILPIGCKNECNDMILQVNTMLRALCEEYAFDYADLYANVVDTNGITMKMVHFGDDLHPHVVGYDLMAEAIYPHLDKIFQK